MDRWMVLPTRGSFVFMVAVYSQLLHRMEWRTMYRYFLLTIARCVPIFSFFFLTIFFFFALCIVILFTEKANGEAGGGLVEQAEDPPCGGDMVSGKTLSRQQVRQPREKGINKYGTVAL